MMKDVIKLVAIVLVLLFANSSAFGQENYTAELYYTRISHVSFEEFDKLNDSLHEVPTVVSDGKSTVFGVELTQELCVLELEERPLAYISNFYTMASSGVVFSKANIIAKVKINGLTQFTISGNREIANESLEVTQLSALDFAKLSSYLLALVDSSACQ